MAFLRTLFINTPEELQALAAHMHSDGVPMKLLPPYAAAQLHGDPLHPAKVELYRLKRPEHNHQAVAELVRSAGHLELQPLPRKGTIT